MHTTQYSRKLECVLKHFRTINKLLSQAEEIRLMVCVLLQARMAVQYVQNLRTTYLAPWTVPYQRTVLQFKFWSVPYPYHYKKGVPYERTVLFSKNWGVPYLGKVCTAILSLNYSKVYLTLKSLIYKSAISIHTFNIGFSCFLPLYTKSRRNVRKVWGFEF